MAKEQRRGAREAKKPKKAKPANAPASSAGASWLTIEKMKAQERARK